MTELHKINVNLSEGQKRKLLKACRDNDESYEEKFYSNLEKAIRERWLLPLEYYFGPYNPNDDDDEKKQKIKKYFLHYKEYRELYDKIKVEEKINHK